MESVTIEPTLPSMTIDFKETPGETLTWLIPKLFKPLPINQHLSDPNSWPKNNCSLVTNQNKMLLANAITLLYMLEQTKTKEPGYWLTMEKLCLLVNSQEECRKMARIVSQANLPDPYGIANWFLNIYSAGHSSVYENTEYIRFVTRYPNLPRY